MDSKAVLCEFSHKLVVRNLILLAIISPVTLIVVSILW